MVLILWVYLNSESLQALGKQAYKAKQIPILSFNKIRGGACTLHFNKNLYWAQVTVPRNARLASSTQLDYLTPLL